MEVMASTRTYCFKWIFRMSSVVLLALLLPACRLVYDEDLSKEARFGAFYGQCFEMNEAALLWRWPDTHAPELTVPSEGYDDLLPITIEEYLQNPLGWSQSPEYNARTVNHDPGEVVAVVSKGQRFVVTKVLMNHHIEVGNTLHAKARLQTKPAYTAGTNGMDGVDEFGVGQLIDGNSSQSALQYHSALVTPCKQKDAKTRP
jgi:hypothetical protein